ncbi:RlpA-like double-psi beta-barrel-protein domain-containing protein-containing protein [Suillus fuscotomentosus]|uniref:RlpA-like double-psi beta-barrel-protein domain-containing protein-containing protein n=1 Tax=Suillus fuscotomentosus TaxID=1912939 RepID=A0AAD4HLE5_9AGAM|nr:RlpA-like double-psi beta-barrel-protein domain-containing protein-containing protein [Suillus fuscotomentosus]KAG1900762.1 RlpA-like double-psi beta-barrel-protein domain-containing protein-containing protein [Suillus fuscotomentosus]
MLSWSNLSKTPWSQLPSFIFTFLSFLPHISWASEWIGYSSDGYATMTHYSLPENFIAACGCTSTSTDYPTAAMNQMAYGSSTSYGPACGQCFNLTLLNSFLSNPPFYPNVTKSVVIKVTDLCPLSHSGWCNATTHGPNAGSHYLNFDLAWPSSSIPNDFFPSNEPLYGYTDFGVWNISYQSVSCTNWKGWNNAAALGSVVNLGYSACCPNNPAVSHTNDTCPSYSDDSGIPYVPFRSFLEKKILTVCTAKRPDTQTSGFAISSPISLLPIVTLAVSLVSHVL